MHVATPAERIDGYLASIGEVVGCQSFADVSKFKIDQVGVRGDDAEDDLYARVQEDRESGRTVYVIMHDRPDEVRITTQTEHDLGSVNGVCRRASDSEVASYLASRPREHDTPDSFRRLARALLLVRPAA